MSCETIMLHALRVFPISLFTKLLLLYQLREYSTVWFQHTDITFLASTHSIIVSFTNAVTLNLKVQIAD